MITIVSTNRAFFVEKMSIYPLYGFLLSIIADLFPGAGRPSMNAGENVQDSVGGRPTLLDAVLLLSSVH